MMAVLKNRPRAASEKPASNSERGVEWRFFARDLEILAQEEMRISSFMQVHTFRPPNTLH